MWKSGSLIIEGSVFRYWMKVYKTGSDWGIGGGRISKLMLKQNGRIVYNYDRGTDVEAVDSDTAVAVQFLVKREETI